MGVYQESGRKTWRFEIWKHGVRVLTKGGYPTEREAIIAENQFAQNLNLINIGFERLTSERLKDLSITRTKKYHREMERFFENLRDEGWHLKKEISRDDLEDYLNKVALEKGNQTANKYLRYIKALFNFGIERGWLAHNPASRIKTKSYTPQERYVPPLADVKKVLESADGEMKLYLLMAINTLGRIGELNKLKWADVNQGYLILKTRKSRSSIVKERRIPLNQVLKGVLKQIPQNGEYVFTNPKTEKPFVYRRKILRNLCLRSGVKPFGYHGLRHLSASLLAEAGIPLTDIQELLGHEKVTTTSIYLRSLKPSLLEATRVLEGIK